MGNIKKYQADGKEVGTIELADDILNTPYHPFLIKNLLTAYLAGQRQGTHKTKGRSEVAGSTRKLYKQKGTGNARAGSIRSPLRRHGGTLFGPVPRDYDKKVNKKERKLALKSALAQLVREDKIAVVSDFSLSTHKTKDYAKALSAWNARSFLLVHDDPDENCIRGMSNISNAKLVHAGSVSIYDLLKFHKIIFTEKSLAIIGSHLQ